MTMINQ